jgi:hypothetical protein
MTSTANSLKTALASFPFLPCTHKQIQQALKSFDVQLHHLHESGKKVFPQEEDRWSSDIHFLKNKLIDCEKYLTIKSTRNMDVLLAELKNLEENSSKKLDDLEEDFETLLRINSLGLYNKFFDANTEFAENREATHSLLQKVRDQLAKIKTKIESRQTSDLVDHFILRLKKIISPALIRNQLYHSLHQNLIFDQARQSPVEAFRSERGSPSQIGKGDEEDRLGKVAAGQKSTFDAGCGIDTGISEENSAKLKKKYISLKKALINAEIRYKSLEAFIRENLLMLKVMPTLMMTYCNSLSSLKGDLETLNGAAKKIDINTLAAKFNPLYEAISIDGKTKIFKPEFIPQDGDKTDVEKYLDQTKNLDEIEKIYTQLNENKKEFLKTIQETLSEISKTLPLSIDFTRAIIETEENQSKEETVESIDNSEKRFEESLKINTKNYLTKLQNKIEEKWNQFCFDLNDLKFQINLFKNFRNVHEKMGLCFMLLQDIFEDLRQSRKGMDYKFMHVETLKNKIEEFKLLSHWIWPRIEQMNDGLNQEMDFENISPYFKYLLSSFNIKFEFNLESDYQKALQLPKPELDLSTEDFAVRSDESNGSIGGRLLQQQEAWCDEYRKYKENVTLGFTKHLKAICEHVLEEIGLAKTTLLKNWSNKKVDLCFPSAYPYKHPVGQFGYAIVQGTTQTVSSFASSVGNYAMSWYSPNQKKEKNGSEEDEINDEDPPSTPPQFEQVKSPFDRQ